MGNRRKIERYYQAMDAFVLPSRYEGLPVVGVEAQACALPLICSTDISRETKLLESTQFISLSEPPRQWAQKVLETAERTTRCNTERQMTEKALILRSKRKSWKYFIKAF